MACANPRQVTILEGVPMQAVAAMSSSSLNACNAADPNGGHAAVSGHASEHLGATELSQNLLDTAAEIGLAARFKPRAHAGPSRHDARFPLHDGARLHAAHLLANG